jgi:hypothetical protein
MTAFAFALLDATAPQAAEAAGLQAGVGRADITPPTGYAFGGWTRADRRGNGQHTRLQATAMVLERDGRKIALVAVDLFAAPGGLVKAAAKRARAGFSERNVLVSASHTHAGPSGFANFDTFNTLAPSVETVGDPSTFVELFQPQPPDRQLYTFLVKRIAKAIRRADRDRGPAAAAWGSSRLLGVTRNRSLEAHLANHGIEREYGEGSVEEDPRGYPGTVDPSVNVLRVDKLEGGRRVPIGAWSTFANHGTVNPSEFEFYNQDHHGAATRGFEARVRRDGDVPDDQEVVNVYGNSNEGDQSAGLGVRGPARAERVGRREARSMFGAWRRAGAHLSRRPRLGLRWTRVCFCGQRTEGGRVASRPAIGAPFLTGSEEGRGPLFDVTGVPLEGQRKPVGVGPQGHKLGVSGFPSRDTVPEAVPLLAIRVGTRMIVSWPGEATTEVGRRARAAVERATAGSGVKRVVVSGLAGEYLQYFTTPEEYDRQHYEGGSTLFGRLASNLVEQELAELAGRLVSGRRAQHAYPFDPRNGVEADAAPFPKGAASGRVVAEPRRAYRRLRHATFSWQGGTRGYDRPLDKPFVVVQRKRRSGWERVTTDLGLEILWSVDDEGRYEAAWEIPRTASAGVYRLRIKARRYQLTSGRFRVRPSREVSVVETAAPPGRVAVKLRYPRARELRDFTYRPRRARGGSVRFRVGQRTVTVRRRSGSVFVARAPAGARVVVPQGAARDRFGNRNGEPLRLTSG